MASLTLTVTQADEGNGWLASWLVDGQTVGRPLPVTGRAASDVNDLSDRFLGVFALKTAAAQPASAWPGTVVRVGQRWADRGR